ncbi:pyruvate dehydrogenase complex dihydrolipoyllysine-residue acetyltransferase [Marinospirillum sp. MEB164]|uniref:Acetyltransferase component of pyruvate dehydrogenase complex n=1 Tax=Marinospirillum alkalitolerans TaxID=3123374 RepID=A0ABW8PV26_9GAMM
MSKHIIQVPDIGGSEDVEVIEISVAVGDSVQAEDTLLVLESDKASMDIPSPMSGRITRLLVQEGDKVSQGVQIIEIETEGEAASSATEQPTAAKAESTATAPVAPAPAPAEVSSATVSQQRQAIYVPDLGGHAQVEIIELPAKVGDQLQAEDTLLTLETDKATMDIPAPVAGELVELLVKEGDKVSEGDLIAYLLTADSSASATISSNSAPAPAEIAPSAPAAPVTSAPREQEVRVPDLGGHSQVEIIELAAQIGDQLAEDAPLITLETDKATMDIPAPFAGELLELKVKVGDKVSEGDLIAILRTQSSANPAPVAASASQSSAAQTSAPQASAPIAAPAATSPAAPKASQPASSGKVHAGPAVRLLAREFGVDLSLVPATGPRGRILKEDVQNYVKAILQQPRSTTPSTAASSGAGIPPVPVQDFSQFGEIEEKPMGRLLKAGAVNLHRSWLNVPHVTQFDQADITELEDFRKSIKAEAEKQGAKLTPLPFIIKACALALETFPQFNVSLGAEGDTLIWKKYINIGFAVDTPDGLLVAVVKDANKKSVYQLARETADLGARAQKKQLKGEDMKGSCFTISSLGSIGGTAFTPIVNAPEVAILGVSKASIQPVWDGKVFQPRLMLPLSLSYDHRAINGADAARFTSFLSQVLADIRRMLL